VLLGVAAGHPEERVLDRAARGLSTAGRVEAASRLRAEARLAAAEAAVREGDRERAAAEAGRALKATLSTEASLPIRARAASLLVRAGKREAGLAELGRALDRGFVDISFLEARSPGLPGGSLHFPGLEEDPAFLGLLRRARERAAREGVTAPEK
jgi:hypothetical protein